MKTTLYIAVLTFFALVSCTKNIPEEDAAVESTSGVEFTDAQFKTSGIGFGKVERKTLSAAIEVNGMLDVPPQNLITVSALMGGF
ncbi:MAG: efflux transporter periplasmic adaptor subunit, partial [Cytophagales bacterium]|nr:efflux transporter periplasmic adaptor subunit [Cytophaga sp.]